jgi:predicted acyltransferase
VGSILIGYYACLMLIPVPGYGAGDLSFEGNLVGWIDRTFLPGRLLQVTYDELGIITQFPAMCLTLLGAFAGEILKNNSFPDQKKFTRLLIVGLISIALALVWSLHFPIAKRLWTSSYILLTAGMAFVILSLFYLIIDILNIKKWSFIFVVIGMNSLTIYMIYRFVNFRHTSRLLFEGLYNQLAEKWFSMFEAFGALVLVWCFLYFLYRKKIFFKV